MKPFIASLVGEKGGGGGKDRGTSLKQEKTGRGGWCVTGGARIGGPCRFKSEWRLKGKYLNRLSQKCQLRRKRGSLDLVKGKIVRRQTSRGGGDLIRDFVIGGALVELENTSA